MAKYQEFESVWLKDGRIAAIVEVVGEREYIADVGSSPKDWDTIDVCDDDINRALTEEEHTQRARDLGI